VPQILNGHVPGPDERSSALGSGDWTTPPRAVMFGGGYTDEEIEELRNLVGTGETAVRIPWLRVDFSIPAPPLGPEYGKAVTQRGKALLDRLVQEGKLEQGNDEVYFF
jgi:hypothetical protein